MDTFAVLSNTLENKLRNLCYGQINQPLTSRIVLHLVDQVLAHAQGTGFHLYTDRYYTGMPLAEKLLERQIHLTGTVQKTRKSLPKAYKKMKIKNGEMKVYRHPDNVMSLCWKDKRPIDMLSTWHNGESETTTRIVRGGRREEIEKPLVMSDYTENMGAVDKADHYCASYSFSRKTLRWWWKLFFWMLEVSLVNSFILYRLETHQPNLTQLQ